MFSQPSLKRMSREQLASILLSPEASSVAVVDVRGDDHVGGHIHDSLHVPSSSLEYRIPELIRTLAAKKTVVFHCALSQERGPRAARWYMEEMEKTSRRGPDVKDVGESQRVYVLDKGFVGWQEK